MCGEDDIVDGTGPPQPPPAEPFPWHHEAFDVHCHCAERVASIENLPSMKARAIVVLATRCQDQELVVKMAAAYGMARDSPPETNTLVPGFGRHPWFSHEIYDDVSGSGSALDTSSENFKQQHYQNVLTPEPDNPAFWKDLPTPVALSTFISDTRKRLEKHPLAIMGEIGLDKAFRLPKEWGPGDAKDRDPARTPGGRQGRPLSPYRIKMSHQEAILRAQLKLAGEMNRPVSVHGVQVHGILYNLLVNCWKGHEKSKRRDRKALKASSGETSKAASQENLGVVEESQPFPPRICLHSFSGKAEAAQQYLNPTIPARIFFSFSKTNNLRDEAGRSKMESAVKAIPKHQLLVETDIHTAGDRMDAELEETYRAISEFKEWDLEDCVKTIANNFRSFIMGDETE